MPHDAKILFAPNRRRTFWILGHAGMLIAVVSFCIAYIQAKTASPDDLFAGLEMIMVSTLAAGFGLVVYGLAGLFVLVEVTRRSPKGTGRRRSDDPRLR
jgi:hypothetical protein